MKFVVGLVFIIIEFIAFVLCDTEQLLPPQCNLPIKKGTGDDILYKFAFSPQQKKCIRFTYSGDGGNANIFDTLEKCKEICEVVEPTPKPRPKVCSLPLESNCVKKYAFDVNSSQCVKFRFAGCESNENLFETMEKCRRTCEVN